MLCRCGCAACCIVISISSPIPGMPNGKPAGVRCVNLSEDNACLIHDHIEYPEICRNFTPSKKICGSTNEYAYKMLGRIEKLTKP